MTTVISDDFEREVRMLTRLLEEVTRTSGPLFERIGVARRVFNGIMAERPIAEIADLAAMSGMHELFDAIDAHALAFELAAFDTTEEA